LKRNKLSPGFVLLLPALLLLPAIAGNQLPFFMDIVTQFFPWRCAVARQLAEGRLPLWTSSMYAGVPLLANPQVAVVYPPNWLFFALPHAGIFTLLFAFHIYLGALGVYLWLCARRFPQPVSLATALLVTVSGATWAHLAFGAYLCAMALFPWMFFFLEKFRRHGGAGWFAGMCLCAALQFVCGALQPVYYSFILYVSWAALNLIVEKCSRRSVRTLIALLTSILLGAGIAAIQLVPTHELIAHTARAGRLPLEMLKIGSLSFGRLLRSFLGTSEFPQDTGDVAYVGAAGLFFILWGVLSSGRKGRWRDVVLWSGLLTLGIWPFSGLYSYILPGYGGFHDPRRILALVSMAGAPLMARGLLSIRLKGKIPSPGRLLLLFLAVLSIFFLWRNGAAGNLQLWNALGFMLNFTFGGSVICSAVLLAAILLADLIPHRRHLWWTLIICLAALEMLNYSLCRVDTKFAPESRIRPHLQGCVGRIIAYDVSGHYSYNYMRPDFADSLMPNLAACEGISDFQGYDPLRPIRYTIFLTILNEPQRLLYASHFGIVRNFDSPLIACAGITHSIGLPKNALAENWKQITFAGEGSAPIYEYLPATGRFAFESDPAIAGSLEEAAEELRWQTLSGKVRGVVEGGAAPSGRGGGSAKIHLRELREGFARIEVDAASEGYIFFREGWFPGWRVFVDGRECPNLPADVAFQAVGIERGRHIVEWRYHPASLARGALISALSCVLLILLILAQKQKTTGAPDMFLHGFAGHAVKDAVEVERGEMSDPR